MQQENIHRQQRKGKAERERQGARQSARECVARFASAAAAAAAD